MKPSAATRRIRNSTPAKRVRATYPQAVSMWSSMDCAYIVMTSLAGRELGYGASLQAAWADAERNRYVK